MSTMPPPRLCERLRAFATLRAQKMTTVEICQAMRVSRQTLWRWQRRLDQIKQEHRPE